MKKVKEILFSEHCGEIGMSTYRGCWMRVTVIEEVFDQKGKLTELVIEHPEFLVPVRMRPCDFYEPNFDFDIDEYRQAVYEAQYNSGGKSL